jgi:hypothetical protein
MTKIKNPRWWNKWAKNAGLSSTNIGISSPFCGKSMANLDVVLVLFQKIIFIHVIQGRFVGFRFLIAKYLLRNGVCL